ncbi:MAG: hypothetical protein WD185_06155 [Sneathiella sp.]
MSNSDIEPMKHNNRPWFIEFRSLIIFVVVALVLAAIFKIALAPLLITLQNLSMSELVSLAISIYAVAMSFAFYFQASRTSNTFYDNTYKFTKDVSEILGRMEGMFGEKLAHLDDNYNRMDRRLDRFSPAKTEKELSESQSEADESKDKRDELIESLMQKAQLQGEERDEFLKRLTQAEEELISARQRASRLERRLIAMNSRVEEPGSPLSPHDYEIIVDFISNHLLTVLGGPERIMGFDLKDVRDAVVELADDLPSNFINAMRNGGHMSRNRTLSFSGARLIKRLAREQLENHS